MDEELKKVYLSWSEKGSSRMNAWEVFETLYETDRALTECDNILSEVGLRTGYVSNSSRLDQLVEDRRIRLEDFEGEAEGDLFAARYEAIKEAGRMEEGKREARHQDKHTVPAQDPS